MNVLDNITLDQVKRFQWLRTKSLFSGFKSCAVDDFHPYKGYNVEPGSWDGFATDAEVDEYDELGLLYAAALDGAYGDACFDPENQIAWNAVAEMEARGRMVAAMSSDRLAGRPVRSPLSYYEELERLHLADREASACLM